ncbi:Right handed beta helix region/Periplasmic copper-binding protein (NosD) [Leishmania donovani]|uniref:Right_handed_beta_helix_region/Periplasmic_copper -binding_protein_(NosD)_putative/Pfam:PF13229/Pfam:PF05048 n=1 Tax=Leishmania donovani TaxID=5661 RepID=A0A6J8FEN2_LEIDO|nr:Right handed beta helix region/Periplasmic copper-binding protein (NosD) [Leishmania donovani]VDZ45809.1 Right_handed_beta_helix_region/Periplasmic_copper-binding_protein_(NosD)_putative/Pfam:PF13229/Pfam:PF05048 [Leishmania donovani]
MYEEAGYAVVQRYSRWQKKKVRTIIVNAHAKIASQKSIAGAIALAKPFDRIELTGGEYHESVAVQMPLELVASEGEDPHIFSRLSTITIATSGIEVYMERIIVSSRSGSKLNAAVVAVAGNPILFRCHCSSLVIGGNAVAHVDECTVKESSSGVGIVVHESGGGIIKSSTIRNHRNVCFDIDTRGGLAVTECTIDNSTGGDAMSISGAVSSISRDSGSSSTSCSQVEVTHCHFSISDDPSSGASGGVSMSSVGSACGIILTQGAAPTIASNEFIEGEIGVLMEGPGTAQLKGNVIRCQRRCGILALVEESFGYAPNHQTLRITGENVIDRCRVGIDAQCAMSRASYIQQQNSATAMTGAGSGVGAPAEAGLNVSAIGGSMSGADRFLSDELPNPKRAFAWTPVQGSTSSPSSCDAACFLPSTSPTTPLVCIESKWCSLDQLRANLQQLVTMTLQANPTCLQPAFEIGTSTASIVNEGLDATSANPFAGILNDMLGTQLSHRKDTPASQREVLRLRGNKGIDIINTKFSNCDICAIRFGRQGYGLVEDCVFEDCGAYAIVVDCAAHPLITGCRFLRSRGASILVSNFANPLIIGNEVASGKRDGIQLASMSRGLIIGNIIATHVGAGIRVDKYSQPLICANAISQNRKGGIAVAEGSKPTILLNKLAANLYAQVNCTEGADAFISHNRITASTDTGIRIDSCSRCTVLSNTISFNGDGILVELDADPYVEDNDITDNTCAGVRACNNALGVFVGNRIRKNAGPNVLLTEGASSVFRANRIENSSQGGVVVCNEGHGFFERNTIATNATANVLVAGAYSEPEFLRNVISSSRSGCGIVCGRSAGGSFLRNSIHGNYQCGVFILEGSNPTFRGNNIAREAVGVLVSDGGKGLFTQNIIEDCYGSGVLAQRQADPVFSQNRVTRSQMSGLHIAPDSAGLFERNEVTRNDIGVQFGSSMDSAVIQIHSAYLDDADTSNKDLSASLQRKASRTAQHRSSVFATNTDASVLRSLASASLQRSASVVRLPTSVVRGNIITANLRGGVLLDAFPNGTLEENDIFQNNAYGVRGDATYGAARALAILTTTLGVADRTSVIRPRSLQQQQQQSSFEQLQTLMLIRANNIYGHDEANIFLDHFDGDKHETAITENTIYGAPYGVCVANNSTVYSMSKNEVHTCMDGFAFASGGHGCYTANHIRDCTYSGVYISDKAYPDFTDANRIEKCGFSGVLVDVNGQGVFLNNTICHCATGVVVFCGPTTPFHVSYEEVIHARILSSTPTFTANTIEENELHGVLLISVISGCPLRSPLLLSCSDAGGKSAEVPPADSSTDEPLHDEPAPYSCAVGGTVTARGNRLCATFEKNIIRRNRMMGVYHDRFEHWDLSALEKTHAETKPSAGNPVKNAHGGYEILLGTSQILDNDEHQRQRQLKQVSLIENIITECSVGVGAGYGCHPYLQRNKIHHNTFFGLLLRFGSAVSAYANDICDNGLAGVYAAIGAKGYIAKGIIESNNGWCRPEASPHTPRSFDDCTFSKSFFTQAMVGTVEEKVRATAVRAGRTLRACCRAYEQMTRLAEVHVFTMTDALRYLAELVAASSGGLTLASGCAPSSLFEVVEDASSSAKGAAASGRRWLGGVALADYADVSTADGGIGVWVQAGSRVTIQGNRIGKHQNSGVLITKGVLQHHSVLHKSFNMEEGSKGNKKLEMVASLPGRAKSMKTTASSATVDIFAGQREAPPLACAEPGALFTTQMLYATGILAAVQVAASTTFESLDADFASFLHHSLSLSSLNGLEAEEKRQRVDSLHHVHIADNVISSNRDGLHVEVFHRLQACATPSAATAAAASISRIKPHSGGGANSTIDLMPHAPTEAHALPRFQRARTPKFSAAPTAFANDTASEAAATSALRASSHDIDVMECAYSTSDFTIVVEGNTVTQNRRYGVYAVHVANVHCERWLSGRSVLNETIASQYDSIRSKLVLGQETTRVSVTLPFELHALQQKVGHALFRKNDLFRNQHMQVCVTSRYVALTQDGDQTLLQLDTTTPLSGSNYASQVLVGVPVMASLLQLPPPGLLLWDENKVRDAKSGVLLCGYLGPHSVRFQRNTFANIASDALCVQGHLACATVGKGNVFERNGVGLRLAQQQRIRLVTSPATVLSHLRTRVFHNTFREANDSSILLECVGEEAPLVYQNEFSRHTAGTAALYLRSERAGGAAVVQGNVFSENYIPVFLVGGSESGVEGPLHASPITLVENRFTCNYVGAIACSGAAPTLERNIFEKNARAGLEVVGSGTRPQLRHCVFREHRRAGDGGDLTMPCPNQGTLQLECRNFSLKLLPENARVLTATSQARLPAGLLIGPLTEPVVDACGFINNDIGVDAVRDAASPAIALAGPKAHFKGCLFTQHQVCGVLVRGFHGAADGSGGGGRGVDERGGGAAKGTTEGRKPTDGAVDVSSALSMAGTTVFERCVFTNNATANGGGDVVAMEDGCATFRENVFCGAVVGKTGGVACFTQNSFIALSDGDAATLRGAAHDSSPCSGAANGAAAAVVIQEGGRIVAGQNTIVHRKVGVQCLPGAEGVVTDNRIVQCVTGLVLAPFNRTDVNKNRVLDSVDCGAVAYGGRMEDNKIIKAPTGILVQHSSVYKGINAVPSHKRDALGFLCIGNRIVDCAKNGLLITTAGVFDGNSVSRCKSGIHIASPLNGGPAGSCPVIKNCSVYDNGVGVCMEHESESVVRDNDIFDNETVGLLVAATATGTLQDNHISSPVDQGAVEMAVESRLKSFGNVIRNQFSPAFQRGTRASRAKDYQLEQADLDRELRDLDGTVEQAHHSMEAVSSGLWSLQQELISMHSRSIANFAALMAGPAGSALRVASARAGTMTAAAFSDKKDDRPTLGKQSISNAKSTLESGSSVTGAAASRKRSLGSVGRWTTGAGTSRVPAVSMGIRKQSKAGLSTKADPGGKATRSAASADPMKVLVHVFTSAATSSGADAVGQAITGVLAKAPLSKYNFISTVSTSTSQLLRLLGGPHPMQPFLCVVVVDANFGHFSPSDHDALQQLHKSACVDRLTTHRGATEAAGRDSQEVSSLFYTVLPGSFCKKDEASPSGDGVMSMEAYAAAHHPFTYTASVEEVLDVLHDRISQDMNASTASAANCLSRSITLQDVQVSVTESTVGNPPIDDDDSRSRSASVSGGCSALTCESRSGSTFLTVEHVSSLFSKLTPEALGLEPSKDARNMKRQKSSVVLSVHEEGDISELDHTRRSGGGSVHHRRGSTASKSAGQGAPAGRRRSSVVSSRSGRRTSVASKKS